MSSNQINRFPFLNCYIQYQKEAERLKTILYIGVTIKNAIGCSIELRNTS